MRFKILLKKERLQERRLKFVTCCWSYIYTNYTYLKNHLTTWQLWLFCLGKKYLGAFWYTRPPKSSLFFSRKIDKVVGCATISGKAHLVGGFNKCSTTKERSNMPQKILENHPRGLFVTSSPPVHPELPSPILEPLVEFVSCEHPGHQPVAQNLRHSKIHQQIREFGRALTWFYMGFSQTRCKKSEDPRSFPPTITYIKKTCLLAYRGI